MHCRAFLFAHIAALLLWTGVAHADANSEAKVLYEKGSAMFALQRYGEAATLYEKAFEFKPDPALLYNAAQAHRLAGNKPRALALYQSLVRMYGDRLSNHEEIRRHVESLKQAIENDARVSSTPPVTTRPIEPAPERQPTSTSAPTASPEPTAAVTATHAAPEKKPLVKKAWFWVVIAGSAAVVATGVGLGVALGTSPADPAITFGTARGN
jgi:tetratricopeptide (TPR) repeat protein